MPSSSLFVALLAITGLPIVVFPVDATAQELNEPGEDVGPSKIADVAATIDPGSYVRVTWNRGRRDVGKLQLPVGRS